VLFCWILSVMSWAWPAVRRRVAGTDVRYREDDDGDSQ
jgi:hypothetical protein